MLKLEKNKKLARRTLSMLEKMQNREPRYTKAKIERMRVLAEQKEALRVFERVHAEIKEKSRVPDQV